MIRYPGKGNVKEEGFSQLTVPGVPHCRNSRLQVNSSVVSRAENKELTHGRQVLISFSRVFVVNFCRIHTVYFILPLSKSPLDSLKPVLCSLPGCVKAQKTVFCGLFCLNTGVLWTFPQDHLPPLCSCFFYGLMPFLRL